MVDTNKELLVKIGARLKKIREDNSMSQSNFAKSLGLAQRVYSYYESGARNIPYSVVIDASNTYSFSITWLILGREVKE